MGWMHFGRRAISAALLCGVCGQAPAHAAERAYDVMVGPRVAGSMRVIDDGAQHHIDFGFSNNGRGPKLSFDITLDAMGMPAELDTRGVDVVQVPVIETLHTIGGKLVWKTGVDAGEGATGRYYMPYGGSPEGMTILARALLAAPDHRLDLLPSGRAGITRAGDVDVTNGETHRKAHLVLIDGLGFGSTPLWLDDNDQLLADAGDTVTVLAGWNAAIPRLQERQQAALAETAARLARSLQQRPAVPVLITGARMFDAEAGVMKTGMSVLVSGNAILRVAPDGAIRAPAMARRIDARGQTLLPGLWDIHVHLESDVDGMLNIANGITSVRDMGGPMPQRLAWRRRFDAGELIGPRLVLGGLIDGRGPTATSQGVQAGTAQEVHDAIAAFAANHYDQIKLYSSFPKDLVPAAVLQAHDLGMKLVGHVPAGLRVDDVIGMGWDGVSHMNFVLLNFLSDDLQAKTNGLVRMLAPAQLGASIDIASPKVAASLAAYKSHGAFLDPTMIVLEGLFTAKPDELRPWAAAYGDRLPAMVLRRSHGGSLAKTDAQRERYTASYQRALQFLKRLNDMGIPMGPGTDGTAGVMLPHELEIWVQAGISPLKVLQDATLGSARMAGRDGITGSITAGKRADLILVEGDPSQDISAIRNLTMVMKDGILFDLDGLDAAVGIRPRIGRGPRSANPTRH